MSGRLVKIAVSAAAVALLCGFMLIGTGAVSSGPKAFLIPGRSVIDNQTGTTARLLPGYGVIRIE